MDAGECFGLIGGGDPVEGGVREDGVELLIVGESRDAVEFDVEVALAGCGEHGGGVVDADDVCSGCG